MEEQQRKEKEKVRLEAEYQSQLVKEKAELERIKKVEIDRLEAIARERAFIEANWPLPPGFENQQKINNIGQSAPKQDIKKFDEWIDP